MRRRLPQAVPKSGPLESLFGGSSLLEEFFGDRRAGNNIFDRVGGTNTASTPEDIPTRSAARRGTGVNIADRLSEQTNKLLQDAAQKAHEFGRTEVDTEHLLFSLTGSDVVQTLLDRFKVDTDDLRR